MFRPDTAREQKRFIQTRQLLLEQHAVISLQPDQLAGILSSQLFSRGEKIELLTICLGYKLSTEIFQQVPYTWNEAQAREIPDEKILNQIETLLQHLPFSYALETYSKTNRQTGRMRRFTWWQVSLNPSVAKFIHDFPDSLTEFEEGVIYGFPLSAVRAFAGLIEAADSQPSTPGCHYLGGVFSKKFYREEQEYFERIWEELRLLSPEFIKECERSLL